MMLPTPGLHAGESWRREDLDLARLAFASDGFDVYELIGVHAQQAVEKITKVFLAKNAVDFEDQHDIDYLQRLVGRVDWDLAVRIDPAAALNRYAVGTRYPGRCGPVTREQAEAAIRIAEAVFVEIEPLLATQPPQRESLRERFRRQRERGPDA